MNASPPEVSIIVPLTGGTVQALRCFEGIASQPPEPSYEVIVVDDASIGLQPLLQRLDGDVQIVRSARRIGFAAAALLGAQRARGETIVLIRDGAAPAPDWLLALTALLAQPEVGLATSASTSGGHTPVLGAWSAALAADDLRALSDGGVEDHLVLAALALHVAQRGLRAQEAIGSRIAPPGGRSDSARRAPGELPELTIVIPTLDATSDRVRGCLQAIASATTVAHEIVIVDNGAPPQGFSAPVNAGIRAARTPYVVVMNDDVEPLPGWWEPLRAAIDAGAPVAFPLTIDGAMRTDFAAWCFAMSEETTRTFGHDAGDFFDPSLVIWYQDTDLLLALRRAGRPPVLVHESTIRHGLSQTVGTEDPELREWVRARIAADEQRFHAKHAGTPAGAEALTTAR